MNRNQVALSIGIQWRIASEYARNPAVKKRLLKLIETLKAIDTLDELHHIKKIEGYDCYYPLRIGDFRRG